MALACNFIEISLGQNDWLLYCSFKQTKGNTSTHKYSLSKSLDICMNRYNNLFFLGDFNSETSENY